MLQIAIDEKKEIDAKTSIHLFLQFSYQTKHMKL